jgi:hypothetical protein
MYQKLFGCLILAILVVAAGPAYAQIGAATSSVYGTTADESGAGLPGVIVSLESEGMAPRMATTGEGGSYRFAALRPGVYSVTFTVEGFTTVQMPEVRLMAGQSVNLDAVMKQSVEEMVVVSGQEPVVDTKKTGASTNFSQEYLANIPSAKDPWVIFDQTPGIDVDRINVGGNESGQQSGFRSKGGDQFNSLWSMDGLNITDPAAQGATPMYFDFESFEEIQITTGGQDPSIQTGGVNINFVTKRAGNTWSGTGSLNYTGKDLQSTNVDEALSSNGVIATNQIDKTYDVGGDGGGPIVKNRAWVWGAARYNSITNLLPITQSNPSVPPSTTAAADATQLTDYNVKGNVSFNSENEGNYQYNWNNKEKQGRTSSGFGPGLQDDSTLWDQTGPGYFIKVGHSWIPSSQLFLDVKYMHLKGAFDLTPKDGIDTLMVERSGNDFFLDQGDGWLITKRIQDNIGADANYFMPNKWGGDHEFKFGFEYNGSNTYSLYNYGGGAHVFDYATGGGFDLTYYPWVQDYVDAHGNTGRNATSAGAGYALALSDLHSDFDLKRTSIYVSDTFRANRLTLNLGVRFDHQIGQNQPTINTNAINPAILPLFEIDNPDPNAKFNNLSPRLGLTFDMSGDGKTVLRGNYARFYDIYSPNIVNQVNAGGSYRYVYMPYSDLNADGSIQPDELLLLPGYVFSNLSVIGAPYTLEEFVAQNKIDPNLKNTTTDEFLVGAEHQLGSTMSFGATYTYRKYDNFQARYVGDFVSGDFTCAPYTARNPISGEVFTGQFCDTASSDPLRTWLNTEGRNRTYSGLELMFNKRMTNNWMLRVTSTIQDQKLHFDNNGESFGGAFQDPSDIPFVKDTFYAYQSSGSGGGGPVFPASRWNVKIGGAYQLPWDITFGATVKIQDGNLLPAVTRRANTRFNGTRTFSIAPFDAYRLETVKYMDMQVEKRFAFGSGGRLALNATCFNVFNTNTVLSEGNRVESVSYRRFLSSISPRIWRIGARFTF